MTSDDTNARRARAARLREQIEQLKKGTASGAPPTSAPGGKPKQTGEALSPREFVHKRMAELKRKNLK